MAVKRRFPLVVVFLLGAYILFFHAGREAFREEYWYGDTRESSVLEKFSYWTSQSIVKWAEVMDAPGEEGVVSMFQNSVMRVSLLTQTANVLERTPATIPYQNGSTYSYLLVTLIPRFLWPEKPSASDANRFYQLAYGLSHKRYMHRVSISSGVLTEGYINFGWPGVVLVMFILGILFDFVQSSFLSARSSAVAAALGVILALRFIAIEAQLAMYVGGIMQSLLLIFLVLLPALQYRRARGRGSLQVQRRQTA